MKKSSNKMILAFAFAPPTVGQGLVSCARKTDPFVKYSGMLALEGPSMLQTVINIK